MFDIAKYWKNRKPGKLYRVRTFQVSDKLYIFNGVDPIRYVDLTKNKVALYTPISTGFRLFLNKIKGNIDV